MKVLDDSLRSLTLPLTHSLALSLTHHSLTHTFALQIHIHNRHVSRATLIEFSLPEVGQNQSLMQQDTWENMEIIKEKASSCVGLCIGLGHALEGGGYEEIRKDYSPLVQNVLMGTQPRVITGYATLLWFTSKVHIAHVKDV